MSVTCRTPRGLRTHQKLSGTVFSEDCHLFFPTKAINWTAWLWAQVLEVRIKARTLIHLLLVRVRWGIWGLTSVIRSLYTLSLYSYCTVLLLLTQLKEHQYITKCDTESTDYNENRDLEIAPKFRLGKTLSHTGLKDSWSFVGLPKAPTSSFVKESGWKATWPHHTCANGDSKEAYAKRPLTLAFLKVSLLTVCLQFWIMFP